MELILAELLISNLPMNFRLKKTDRLSLPTSTACHALLYDLRQVTLCSELHFHHCTLRLSTRVSNVQSVRKLFLCKGKS